MKTDGLLSAFLAIPNSIFDSFMRISTELGVSFWETVYMTLASTFFSVVLGFGLAILLILTGPQGLSPNLAFYRVLDVVVNLLRSLPFIILIIFIMPLTRIVMGTPIGTTATIFPLTVAAAPFAARLFEACFLEVSAGVVEAAKSFGANRRQIILKVMLPEALPSLVLNIAVVAIALVGYSAMAGAVGGGGLGDLALRIGYIRFQTDVTLWCVLLLIIFVQAIQSMGNFVYRKIR